MLNILYFDWIIQKTFSPESANDGIDSVVRPPPPQIPSPMHPGTPKWVPAIQTMMIQKHLKVGICEPF